MARQGSRYLSRIQPRLRDAKPLRARPALEAAAKDAMPRLVGALRPDPEQPGQAPRAEGSHGLPFLSRGDRSRIARVAVSNRPGLTLSRTAGRRTEELGAGEARSNARCGAADGPSSTVANKRRATAAEVELVAGVLAGRVEPFSRFYELLFPHVYRYARRRLGDPAEAEEMTKEAFETLLLALPRFEGDPSLLPWAFKITRRHVDWNLGMRLYRARGIRDAGRDFSTPT